MVHVLLIVCWVLSCLSVGSRTSSSEVDFLPANFIAPEYILNYVPGKSPTNWFAAAACHSLPYVPMHIPIRVFALPMYKPIFLMGIFIAEALPDTPYTLYHDLLQRYNVTIGFTGLNETFGVQLAFEEPDWVFPKIQMQHDLNATLHFVENKLDKGWNVSITLDMYFSYPYKPFAYMSRPNVYRVPTYYPFPMGKIPPITDKIYDIICSGCSVAKEVQEALLYFNKTLVVCKRPRMRGLGHKIVNVDFDEQMRLISASRIMIAHNTLLLYCGPFWQLCKNITGHMIYQTRKDYWPYVPNQFVNFDGYYQWKARTSEAFFCRAVVLFRWDPFLSPERLGFRPGQHFVYYQGNAPPGSPMSLIPRIKHILNHWRHYERVALAGHNFAKQHLSTQAWWRDYIGTMRTPRRDRQCAS